jgi:hypothetical protein
MIRKGVSPEVEFRGGGARHLNNVKEEVSGDSEERLALTTNKGSQAKRKQTTEKNSPTNVAEVVYNTFFWFLFWAVSLCSLW